MPLLSGKFVGVAIVNPLTDIAAIWQLGSIESLHFILTPNIRTQYELIQALLKQESTNERAGMRGFRGSNVPVAPPCLRTQIQSGCTIDNRVHVHSIIYGCVSL